MDRQERIEKRKKDYNSVGFIVAELDNEIVGFCRYNKNVISADSDGYDCELMALYVKPDLKRNGIGRKLIEYAKDEFRKLGKTKMILWCLKENYPSRAFYEKMGGKIVAEHDIQIGEKYYPEVGFGYKL